MGQQLRLFGTRRDRQNMPCPLKDLAGVPSRPFKRVGFPTGQRAVPLFGFVLTCSLVLSGCEKAEPVERAFGHSLHGWGNQVIGLCMLIIWKMTCAIGVYKPLVSFTGVP